MKIIGLIKVMDDAAFAEYRDQVSETISCYGGTILSRGVVSPIAWNELNCEEFQAIVELSFPSEAAARSWMSSPEYSKLLEIRSKAMRLTLFGVS